MKLIRTATISASLNSLLKGQLKYLSNHYEVIAISGQDEFLEELKEREGVKILSVSMQRKISPLKDLMSLLRLYLRFKKEKPEIVHSITPKAGLLSMLAAKLARVPIRMHTFTGLIFPTSTGFMQKLLIKMDQLLCWAATHIYPEGNGVRDDLIKYKITSKPLKVIGNGNINGIDIDYFSMKKFSIDFQNQTREKLDFSKDDFIFIFVGRLVSDKGVNELVASFKSLDNVGAKLLLVGSMEENLDPLNLETRKEIEKNKNIVYVGFQKDVRPYFAISNALVFPSYREGFPNVVLQAGAMELPSIVTNVNGCNEIIIDGENGIIIPQKNKDAILNAMLFLLNNPKELEQMKQKARPLIVKRYEQTKLWEAMLNEYRRLEGEYKIR